MDQNNSIEFAFEKVKDFDENWNEFLKRKIINSKERRAAALEQDQTQQNFMKVSKRSVRNPTPVEPLEASSTYDEQKQDEDE